MSSTRDSIQLASINLLIGSEPLLLRDWLDQARLQLQQEGYDDILSLQADTGFDWNELLEDGDSLSLFSSCKCRIVNLPGGKPGQTGARAIQSICQNPAEGSLYIFVSPVSDRQVKSSAWFKSIQGVGQVVELKPVYPNQLADWVSQRARGKGFDIDMQAAQFLAERTEGNLLAADQELEKLSIRFPGQARIDFDAIESSVGESARYSHFLLVDACLAGDTARALRILSSLQREGYATPQLRWALQNALENLNQLKLAQSRGGLSDRQWQNLRIWRGQQRLYQSALQRLSLSGIERLLQSCATLDRLGKGQQGSEYPNRDWQQIQSMVTTLSGKHGLIDERGTTQRI